MAELKPCCGMHGNLCHLADDVTGLCCGECPLLAGHIEIVGYRQDPEHIAGAEQVSADVYDAGVRALLQCPDVPQYAHISMATLHRTAAEVAPADAIRAAFDVVFTAGVKHGMGLAETLTDDVIEQRASDQVDALLSRVFGSPESRHDLGKALDDYLCDPPILPTDPYARRVALDVIVEAFGEMLGVDDAS